MTYREIYLIGIPIAAFVDGIFTTNEEVKLLKEAAESQDTIRMTAGLLAMIFRILLWPILLPMIVGNRISLLWRGKEKTEIITGK